LCKNNPQCQFVIQSTWGVPTCYLKKDIASNGPHGGNYYQQGLRAAVAFTRLNAEQVDWQWARGPGSVEGELVQFFDNNNQMTTSMQHGEDGKANTVLCQLVCLTLSKCTHIVYNTNLCWFMNAFGDNKVTIYEASNTAVDLQKWSNFQ
jgi:hypothetical protein